MTQRQEREDTCSQSLTVRWVQGFPKQNVQFVNNETICYPSGNYLIFINIETNEKMVLQCMNGIVGVMATNTPYEVVAFSDRKLKPLIYIYNFPGLTKNTILKGNVLLDYTLLTFSHCGTYLASYSSLPEYELAIWNWESQVILCKKSQPGIDMNQMTFNPLNWRQLCLSNSNMVMVWTIERSDHEHHLRGKSVKLPAEDGSVLEETDSIFSHAQLEDPVYGPVLPVSAIAGLVGEEAETFRPKDDLYPLLHPTMHCWTAFSDLYIGCEEGSLLMVNGETLKATVLNKTEEPTSFEGGRDLVSPVTLVYQKEGIFASGIDGLVYSFIIKDSSYKVQDFIEVDKPVEHLQFSPNYKTLLIQTEKGSIHRYTFGEKPALDKILDACDGNIQAIDFITPGNSYFMTLTDSGEIGIWWLEDGSTVSKMPLDIQGRRLAMDRLRFLIQTELSVCGFFQQATVLACSPSSLSAAVGATDGSIYFLDVSHVRSPREIHKAFLSEASVTELIYDQRGLYLLAGTSEGYLFVINAMPSSSFEILGFTEVGKSISQISTVSLLESDIVEVMVLSTLPKTGRSRLEIFTLPTVLPTVMSTFTDERGRMRDEFIHKFLYEIDHVLSSAVLDFESHQILGFCYQWPYICIYPIPEQEHIGVCVLKPFKKVPSRLYGHGKVDLSPHGLWLLTAANCGTLSIRDAFTLVPQARSLSIDSSQEELDPVQDTKEIPWMQAKSQEAIKKEVREFSKKRREIKNGIKALAQTVLSMMEENETVNHIARLEQQEFGLDVEELEKLHDESEEEVAKIKNDAEMDNLAKRYLTELIKEECWNSMAVKGRVLKCFHIPCTVENFPMKERTNEELKELENVLYQKKIEAECLKVRKEIVEAQATVSGGKKHQEEDDEEEEEEHVTMKDTNLPNYLLGSLSSDFGVDTSILSSQLELHTREEKINQIVLLKDIIYKVKTVFNNEFNAAYKQKEFEIARVRERNVRLREIIVDLELEETIWQPDFEDGEKPERSLVVEDSEHLDTRQRALMDMMGGVLEVKKEDILRMVIPQPAFMAKPDALWTEEERKQLRDYEKKVKELNEERDKYRKSLEAEMKKLQNSILESTQAFDEHLKRLFGRRVKAEMVINQEELKINNLLFSLLLDEELNTREQCLNNYLARKQEEKVQTTEAIRIAKEDLDIYKEHYDNLVAEDKVLDRSFKKEFPDIPTHQVDLLYKLFKRRPRIQRQKIHRDTCSFTPYGDQPGSDRLNKDAFSQLMKAMDELDHISNMPEGLGASVWEHFCLTRRAKVENEHKVKQKATGLMEMMAFLRKRIEEDEKVQQNIEKVFRELVVLQEEKVKFQMNLTIQILLKQGQVELENFQFTLEYSDAILINKNIIEDLNSVIRTQGQKKVTSMMESRDVHKGIYQIEWEHKKMEMEMEDLNQKAWDIQMLFFSRDRQKFLNEPHYETLIAIQIGIMEQTIAVLDKTHKKNVENCKKLLQKLGRYSSHKDVANYHLSCNLREELVAVSERRDICNAIGSKLTCEKIAKEKYDNMMQQQKLTNISKQQAEQIFILEAEVERLRMKTFPAVTHL
ncbi:cilia- and flagella-associated protein 43 [Rhynchocyon petersi]